MEAQFSSVSRIIDAFPAPPGLYLHVPFCSAICPFCPYNKVIYDRDLAKTYMHALDKELRRYTDKLPASFTSLYIGGGTPTLCLDQLSRLMESVEVSGERAIEVLPTHASPDNLDRLVQMGINYVSLGIQSLNERVLRHLHRPNTVMENRSALHAVAGRFECVDVDLIFDVAFEDRETFLRDLEICFGAGVEQVSTYPLMRFGYTPFGKTVHQPGKERRLLREAAELADRHGYERRSVWTFARRDAPSYTSITREFYLGCGAGSGSYAGRLFFVNHFAIPEYIAKVSSGALPIARGTYMTPMRAAAYYLFWQLYTGRIDLARFRVLFPGARALRSGLAALTAMGLLRRSGDKLSLTPAGYDRYHDLERWVTYHFIEPLWADMMREHKHFRDAGDGPSRSERLWLRMTGLQP